MGYRKPNQKIIERYTAIYQKAKEHGNVKACFMGVDKKFRITNKDSYFSSITDPEVLLEFVLYPLYIDGEKRVEDELVSCIRDFANSKDPLEYYQAYSFLYSERMLAKVYGEIPFIIFDKSIIKQMNKRLPEMAESLQNYKEGEFAKYTNTLFNIIT